MKNAQNTNIYKCNIESMDKNVLRDILFQKYKYLLKLKNCTELICVKKIYITRIVIKKTKIKVKFKLM